jgi:hypothetical protein
MQHQRPVLWLQGGTLSASMWHALCQELTVNLAGMWCMLCMLVLFDVSVHCS